MKEIKPLLLSVEETRQLLGGRGRGHVYALIGEGKLESVKDGSRRFIVAESLDRYVKDMPRVKVSDEHGQVVTETA